AIIREPAEGSKEHMAAVPFPSRTRMAHQLKTCFAPRLSGGAASRLNGRPLTPSFPPVRKTLRWLAVLLALLTLAMWLAGGWNRGWTKTSVMLKSIDPVTEQEIIEWKRQFVP